ncbi:MAG: thiolase family protein [Elusimicrobia bacterium]|nr:thiolase family protein [Elusimicrobiota bacterium]
MNFNGKRIVIAGGVRTPFGHMAKSLASIPPQELMAFTVKALLEKTHLDPQQVDGLMVGCVGQPMNAGNIARVSALLAGLPEKVQNVTFHNNCVSSYESISSAVRFIAVGEGELYIAGGADSMSQFPYVFTGNRSLKPLRSLDSLKQSWPTLLDDKEVSVVDSIEIGLTDYVKKINMAGTAEICAQVFDITREEQDAYAIECFKKILDAWNKGFFSSHVVPFRQNGNVLLEKDEYPFLREDLVAKPHKFAKAPLAFDNSAYSIKRFYEDYAAYLTPKKYEEGKTKGTISLFNACVRSDGAAAMIITTMDKAKALGLPVVAEIKSWAYCGNNPVFMGICPALATDLALERAGASFENLDIIEIHEPFAATVLSVFKVGKEKFGHDWEGKYKSGKINPHGGTLALGHPLGPTGARLLLALAYGLQAKPEARLGLTTCCAGGGVAGALVLEKI